MAQRRGSFFLEAARTLWSGMGFNNLAPHLQSFHLLDKGADWATTQKPHYSDVVSFSFSLSLSVSPSLFSNHPFKKPPLLMQTSRTLGQIDYATLYTHLHYKSDLIIPIHMAKSKQTRQTENKGSDMPLSVSLLATHTFINIDCKTNNPSVWIRS